INPTRVCWTEYTVNIHADSTELKGKTTSEKKTVVEQMHKKKMVSVALYLGRAMVAHRQNCPLGPLCAAVRNILPYY
ncbi:hypothetical protein ACYTX8_09305, partial [Streptococcus pyogenes]